MRLRHEAQHDNKAHAMASRTKDNLKVISDSKEKTTASGQTQEESVVDLKHLFTKHDRRVPHLPSEKIPDMLSMMKERQKQRQLAREEAKRVAEAAEIVKRKPDRETAKSHLKHKTSSSHATDNKKHDSAMSSSVVSKSVSADMHVKSRAKVVKKDQPRPMSFEQLIALAAKKQEEPVIGIDPSDVSNKVSTEPGRPMTQEEKDRQKRRETKEYQDWLKYGGPAPPATSGRKSQKHADESYKGHRTTVSSEVSGSDVASDSETDEVDSAAAHTVNGRKSYTHTGINSSKSYVDAPCKQSSAARFHSEKLPSSRTDSIKGLVERSKPVSHMPLMFTKGRVMPAEKGNGCGQNGKSKSLSDELFEKLKEERRRMADRGDAVPSLADMLQDLLNKVHGNTESQASAPIQSFPSETRSLKRSTCHAKLMSEQKVGGMKSVSGGVRRRSAAASETQPSYTCVNETVVDCSQDMSNATKPVKSGSKLPMKSTWEEMYERAKAKSTNHDGGILPFLLCIFCIFVTLCV